MRTISKLLFNSKITELTSAPINQGDIMGGAPKSLKSTNEVSDRILAEELELTYMHNPIVFNSINKITQTIMSAPHEIKAEDPKVQKFFIEFTKTLGLRGSMISWDELLSQTFQNQCIYGKNFIENIYNKKGDKIVDWDSLDVKRIDYAKDSNDNIVLNANYNPVGYFQTVVDGTIVPKELFEKSKMEAPKEVVVPENTIYLSSKRIAQFKLYSVGDGFYPLGLVESIYKISLRKLNMEDALANAVYRHGFPIIHASLGDDLHEPTPKQINSMTTKLKDVNFRQEITTPYYYNLNILEAKNAEKLKEHLDYFIEQEVAGLGVPEPYATGIGRDTNRSVLDNQSNLFQLTLSDIVKKTITAIRQQLFAPLAKSMGFKEVPTIDWDIIGVAEQDKKSKRIIEYVKAGLFSSSDPDIIKLIKGIEHLGTNLDISPISDVDKEQGKSSESGEEEVKDDKNSN